MQYVAKSKIIKVGDYVANSDAIKHPLFRNPRLIKVTAVYFGHSEAIIAQDTDYNEIKVMVGTTKIASALTGPAATGQSYTAGDYVAATLVAAAAEIAAGSNIELNFAKTGNGLAGKGLVVQIDYQEYDS